MTKETYRYRVTHPDLGTAEVTGADKLHAIHAAAKKWGVPWTGIARACTYERLGPVKRETKQRKKEAAPGGDGREQEVVTVYGDMEVRIDKDGVTMRGRQKDG